MRALALLLLAACGSSHHGPDGGGGDDGGGSGISDAPPVDVPFVKGTVKVTVSNASVALCNTAQLHVVFVDVDQTTTDVLADAQGKAQADVFPGASVTAVCERTTGTTTIAVTVQDVEPGDDITLDGAYFFTGTKTADQTVTGSMKISFPANGGGYTVETPCGEIGTTQNNNVGMPMKAGCQLATMDLVVTTQTQWTEAKNVAFVNNGTVTVTDTWHAMAPVTASYTNAPAFCADTTDPDYPCNVELDRYVPELHGNHTMSSLAITNATSLIVTSPTSSAAIMQTQLTSTTGPEYQIFTDTVDGSQTTYAIDFGARSLPWLCRKTAQCPSFSGTAAKLTIPVTGTGSYDLFETDVQWTRAPQNTQIFIWRVFGPTAGDVTFPTLPASVATMNPTAQDHQSVTHARICESDALSGWRAARQDPFDSLGTCLQSTNPTALRYGGTHDRVSASQ